ncbi:MAG: flagellar biosynthetic protein FliR [Gemmobacter sp.]|nr:flagellar biosynthetic protein FliR [Gemmobacter sp.]
MEPPALPALDLVPLLDQVLMHFVLVVRIGAFLVAAPFLGARYVPVQVRIVLSFALALPLWGRVPLPPPDQIASLGAVPMIAGELVLGLAAGSVLTILFSAAALAGDRIANTAGLGFAAQFDPSAGGQTPVISQLFTFGLMMVFVTSDGHLAALRIVLDSYASHPPGSPINLSLLAAGIESGARMFALGLMLSLPVMGLLVLVNVAVGVLTRSAPQFNVFSFGFPLTMAATVLMLYVSAPHLGHGFRLLTDEALLALSAVLGTAHGQ